MADVQEILQLAEKLGKAIADSPQAARLDEARRKLDDQPEVRELIGQLNKQAQKIGELEQQNKPVEVEDKQKLREIQSKLVAQDVFKTYQSAQVDYMDLMTKVSQQIRAPMGAADPGAEGEATPPGPSPQ